MRSDHVTNVLLGMIVVLLAVVIFRPTVSRLTERLEPDKPRFGERTFTQWQVYLRDLSPAVRQRAIEALGYFGPKAVPALVQSFKGDANAEVRISAAGALGSLGSAATDAGPPLIEASSASEPRIRAAAAVALGKLGPDVKGSVPALIKGLKDPETLVRVTSVQALGDLGAAAKDAVPALVELLKDGNTSVQQATLRALGKLGPVATEAAPELRRLVADDRAKALRPLTEESLAKIEGR